MDKEILKELIYVVLAGIAFGAKWVKDRKDKKTAAEVVRVSLDEKMEAFNKAIAEAMERLSKEHARYIQEKAERSGAEISTQIDRNVRHAAGKILSQYKAQRTFVIHFSNGTVTDAGIHLVKLTFKSEVLESFHVEPLAKYFNEIPVHDMFKSPMTLVFSGLNYYVEDVEKLSRMDQAREDYYDWLTAYKVRSVLWMPIRGRNDRVVAIFVMHWFATTSFSKSDISKMSDMKREIERIYEEARAREQNIELPQLPPVQDAIDRK